jgi:hypothetical protein
MTHLPTFHAAPTQPFAHKAQYLGVMLVRPREVSVGTKRCLVFPPLGRG